MTRVPYIENNYNIKPLTSFKMGGNVSFFAEIESKEELLAIWPEIKKAGLPVLVLGGGSNIVINDTLLERFVLKMSGKDISVILEQNGTAIVEAQAGVVWEDFVDFCVKKNYQGVEALSLIPGTVGATPIQNIGAYGQEVKDTIDVVEVFDTKEEKIKNLSNADCSFGYRDSLFKNEEKGRYIITKVIFNLKIKETAIVPNYKDLKNFFGDKTSATLQEIRDAVIVFRTKKLPDPSEIPNVGSFFKNPIVSKQKVDDLKKLFPEVVYFDVDELNCKVAAGWLIEHVGLKGVDFGHIKVSPGNALVLTNDGEGTFEELLKSKDKIINKVKEVFGIELENEPELFEK